LYKLRDVNLNGPCLGYPCPNNYKNEFYLNLANYNDYQLTDLNPISYELTDLNPTSYDITSIINMNDTNSNLNNDIS